MFGNSHAISSSGPRVKGLRPALAVFLAGSSGRALKRTGRQSKRWYGSGSAAYLRYTVVGLRKQCWQCGGPILSGWFLSVLDVVGPVFLL